MMKAGTSIKPGQMSMILIIALVAMIALLVGGSALATAMILKKSTDATHAQIDAQVSAGDPARLAELKQYLAAHAQGISQTADLTKGLGKYDQNTIIATLSGYAAKAGVNVTNFSFDAPAATIPGAAPAPNNGTVDLTLGSTVPYQNFLVFLRLVEQGLMPATVTSAQISADPDKPDSITVTGLSIKVTQ